jgi:hypothetical protein
MPSKGVRLAGWLRVNLKDKLVNFRIRDVWYPDPRDLMNSIYGQNLLQGTVCDLTESSEDHSTYLVVKVEGFPEPVVVPESAITEVL